MAFAKGKVIKTYKRGILPVQCVYAELDLIMCHAYQGYVQI